MPVSDIAAVTRWSRGTLFAFRFAFAVAVLSFIQVLSFIGPYLYFPSAKSALDRWLQPIRAVEASAQTAVGGFALRLFTAGQWRMDDVVPRSRVLLASVLTLITIAAVAAIVWTIIDRRRAAYPGLNRGLRVYARYALAMVAMVYAVVKIVPTQFGFLTPGEMLKPVGELNRFWMLWNFMATSTGYTMFAGLAELAGCVLLFFRRTTLVGALILGAVLTNILAMDVAYYVSGAAFVVVVLLALDGIVLAPYMPALTNVLLRGRAEAMPAEPWTPMARWRYGPVVIVALLVALVSIRVHDGVVQRRAYFGRGHALYGMFDVVEFTRNGVRSTPLADDNKTWKRVGSDGRYDGAAVTVQFANAAVREYWLADDVPSRTWTLREGDTERATLRYTVAADQTVALDGKIGTDTVHMSLRSVDLQTFPLLRTR